MIKEMDALFEGEFCTDCALNTCVCSLVKLELKIEALKLNEEVLRNEKKKRKRDAEDEEEVKQQDSQPVFGSNAAQQEGVGQQLRQQALDGGAAAPQKVEREDQKQERGGKAESLKPSEIRRREKSAKKRRKCEGQGQAVQQTISTYLRTKPTQLHPVDIITPTQPSIERSTPTNETIIWVEARPAMPPGVPTQEKLLTSPPTQIPQPPRNSRMLRVENHSSPLVDWRPENKPSPSPPPNIPHSPKASKANKIAEQTRILVETRTATPSGVPTQERTITPQPPINSRMLRVENNHSPLVDWRPEKSPLLHLPPISLTPPKPQRL